MVSIKKVILYIGLNDKDRKMQIIDTVEAYKIVTNIITKFAGGGTIYNATGIYTHADGTIVIENTLRVEIIGVDDCTIKDVVDHCKIALNQESIIKQTENVTSEYC